MVDLETASPAASRLGGDVSVRFEAMAAGAGNPFVPSFLAALSFAAIKEPSTGVYPEDTSSELDRSGL